MILLFRPRNPGDAFEVWHITPRPDGAAEVIVERETDGPGGPTMLARPFLTTLTRLARLVEEEADRVMPAAQMMAKRLRDLAAARLAS
uniref:Uncharacterized protein n=1 Tax=Thermus islandicus TaxID=540988 RepID=A0A831UFA6_9DEIN